tara:strand:- start:418 stop:888 length:471 start_codon:yes stop_codon:yes gene_type:complete
MKIIWKFKTLFIILILLYSCAKPTVVNITLPSDENLSCQQLENEIATTQKIKKDAEYAKEGTGGNVTRMLLFWPAWARTLHNADTAIQAANDRNFHLINIMKKNKCKGVNVVNAQIEESITTSNSIAGQLKILKDLYNSGDITKEEFAKAKNKILN